MIRLENDDLSACFHEWEGWIAGLYDKRRGLELVRNAAAGVPFRLDVNGETVSGFERFHYEQEQSASGGSGYRFTWELSGELEVRAAVRLADGVPELVFTCEVVNRSAQAVHHLEYPIVPNIRAITADGENDFLAHSFATGFLVRNPLNSFTKEAPGFRYMPYPEGFSGSTMQFFSYYGQGTGGLYFAAYDSDCHAKWLNGYRADNGLLEASFIHGCEDIGPCRGIAASYPVVVRTIGGDGWYESAELYKAWAVRQFWCARGPLVEADDDSKCQWLLEETGVATFGINAGSDRTLWLKTYHEHMPTRMFHILGPDWARSGQTFTGSLPGGMADWLPAQFDKANLNAIRQYGDTFAPFEFDYLFNCNGADGELGHQSLQVMPDAPKSIDKYRFPFVCPASPYVRELHVARDEGLMRDSNPDSIYYDISANNILKVCMDDTHGHPVGAGRQLAFAYLDNFARTKEAVGRAAGRYVPLGTEMMNEMYLGVLDYYQARAGAQPAAPLEGWNIKRLLKSGDAELIPLFDYVYHEYGAVRLDGWGKLVKEIGDLFYFTAARTYLWGGLYELNCEYSPMEAVDGVENDPEQHYYPFEPRGYAFDAERARYIAKFARLRTGTGNNYLAYGTMLRPLAFNCKRIELSWFLYNCSKKLDIYNDSGRLTVDSVVHTAWLYKTESAGLFFANADAEDTTVQLTVQPSQLRLNGERYALRIASEIGIIDMGTVERDERKRIALPVPARDVVMIELTPLA